MANSLRREARGGSTGPIGRQVLPLKFADGPTTLAIGTPLLAFSRLCSLTPGRWNTSPTVGRVTSHFSSLISDRLL